MMDYQFLVLFRNLKGFPASGYRNNGKKILKYMQYILYYYNVSGY